MKIPRFLSLAMLTLCLPGLVPEAGARFTKGRHVEPSTVALKAGDYIWHPEVSPNGPVVVLVSIPEQTMHVYRNGVRIGRSTVSTGTKGHSTPTGVFTVLQKKVDHTSTIYKGAKMPHMQRLTWTGIAMHAGHLPGYPASHGCVRLPVDFAEKLYSVTSKGTTVIIADNKSAPDHTVRPGMLFSGTSGSPLRPPAEQGFEWEPDKAPKGPVSIILSGSDREVYVYRNGVEIGRATVDAAQLSQHSGTHVYSALETIDASGQRDWMSTASVGGEAPDLKDLSRHLAVPPSFLEKVHALITQGTTLVLTSSPVNARTHSAPGFEILEASAADAQAGRD